VTRFRRPRWPAALGAGIALALIVFAYGWETQSGYYAFLPDPAHPVVNVVHVPGGQPPAKNTGFYFVDVNLLHANLIQKLWAEHLVDGAALVPDNQVLAPGQSNHQRVIQDMHAMVSSQETAQVVAERALGDHVPIDRQGALILSVDKGDPADRAGINPGDIITQANGAPVHSAADLIAAMKGVQPGQTVHFTFEQAGDVAIRTTTSPGAAPHHAIIGVSIGDAVQVGKLPVHVHFTTGGIGGPSAGLAFALDIYDALSGRHLLRGHKIAVTGELDLGGGVHSIGGVDQKTVGAIEAGDDTFLVPAGQNIQDARRVAHGRIRLIAITSFAQALAAIRALPPR
jgi:PDZ domain-containing protein